MVASQILYRMVFSGWLACVAKKVLFVAVLGDDRSWLRKAYMQEQEKGFLCAILCAILVLMQSSQPCKLLPSVESGENSLLDSIVLAWLDVGLVCV